MVHLIGFDKGKKYTQTKNIWIILNSHSFMKVISQTASKMNVCKVKHRSMECHWIHKLYNI